MRLMVTGAAGFIASHLAEALAHDGHSLVGLDRKPRPDWWASRDYIQSAISGVAACYFGGLDAVIHLAAQPGTLPSWTNLGCYLRDNVEATGCLIERMAEAGTKRLIHVSSSSVYGHKATGAEDAPCTPISPYGVTKLAGEHLVDALCRDRGIKYTILRPFSVYGPHQRPDMFFHIAIERLMNGQPIEVTGDGEQQRSFTYVGDVVDAIERVLCDPRATGDVYNVGATESWSITQCVATLGLLLGTLPDVEYLPTRRGDQWRTAANSRRLFLDTGWTAKVPLEAGLTRQVAWHLERQRGVQESLL